jgi:hypothetical protein
LVGAWGDQAINILLAGFQWRMYSGGEASFADEIETWKNLMAKLGWYNGQSPITAGAQSTINNVPQDASWSRFVAYSYYRKEWSGRWNNLTHWFDRR